MKPLRSIYLLIGFALAFAGALLALTRIQAIQAEVPLHESLYIPNPSIMKYATGGHSAAMGDLLWLQCIQYVSRHFNTDEKYEWLYQMCDVITDLDPQFLDVYVNGAIFLACLKDEPKASLRLLEKGRRTLPHSYRLPYEMAMIHLVSFKDFQRACDYLEEAVKCPDAPEGLAEFTANFLRSQNLREALRGYWGRLAQEHESKAIRQMALQKLLELALEDVVEQMQAALTAYLEAGNPPTERLEDLVERGFLRQIPEDPAGGQFFIDPDDNLVKNTTLLDARNEPIIKYLEIGLERFHAKENRYPETLDELVSSGTSPYIPIHPYGRQYQYDPATGAVQG